MALITYDAEHQGAPARVTAAWHLQRAGVGWADGGGMTDIVPAAIPPAAIEFVAGESEPIGLFAYAGGLVRDPAITQVAVTFLSDAGVPERVVVAVEQGTYLVAKEGADIVGQVEALDSTGRVVATRGD